MPKQKPIKADPTQVALLGFAYWVIKNRIIWMGLPLGMKLPKKQLWDAAELLVVEWKKQF